MTGVALYKPRICASVLGVFLCSKGADEAVDGAMFPHIMSLFHSGSFSAFAQVVTQYLEDVFVDQ